MNYLITADRRKALHHAERHGLPMTAWRQVAGTQDLLGRRLVATDVLVYLEPCSFARTPAFDRALAQVSLSKPRTVTA